MKSRLLLLAAAVLPACSQPFPEDDDPDARATGIQEPRAAYYLVQAQDLRGEPTDGVPAPDLTQYGFLVCTIGLDPAAVRAVAPQATLFAYVSSHWVPFAWGQGDPIVMEWVATFDSSSFWVDSLGTRASTWAGTDELLYTVANGTKLADFVLQNLSGWDGIYVDDCWGDLSPIIYNKLPVPQSEWPQVEQDWDAFQDAFLLRLRAGTSQLIVGNSNASIASRRHIGLDGFACEEWNPPQRPAVLEEFQRYDPSLCVTWEWDAFPLARPGDIRYR